MRHGGVGHSPGRCAPNVHADGVRKDEVEAPTPAKRKKARRPKRFKWSISGGLRNALVTARHGSAFEEDLAPYVDRKKELELLTWAAGHTCIELRKLRGMGAKKLGELLRRLARAELRLTCGCPCEGSSEREDLLALLRMARVAIKEEPDGAASYLMRALMTRLDALLGKEDAS